jgi:hypothetical protein
MPGVSVSEDKTVPLVSHSGWSLKIPYACWFHHPVAEPLSTNDYPHSNQNARAHIFPRMDQGVEFHPQLWSKSSTFEFLIHMNPGLRATSRLWHEILAYLRRST